MDTTAVSGVVLESMSDGAARAAIYARVSTDEQAAHGTSLAGQLVRCRSWAATAGAVVCGEHVDEVSGATLDRPALRALLGRVAAGGVDVVVCTDPDRWSRDLLDGLLVERQLAERGVDVVYVDRQGMSTLERQIRGAFAEEERRKITERTSRGVRSVARSGWWPAGLAPFGYRIVHDGPRSRLEIDDTDAATLREAIRCLVDEHLSTLATARRLNTLGHLPRKGGRWNHQSLRHQLRDARGLSGRWTFRTADHGQRQTIEIAIPAIVSPERHAQLLEVLAATSTVVEHRGVYLVSGRLVSPCGAPMYGIYRKDRDSRAYRCKQRDTTTGPGRCTCANLDTRAVDQAVWAEIVDLLTNPAQLVALASARLDHLDAAQPVGARDLAALDRRIRRREHAVGRHVADLLAQGMDAAVVQHATAALETDLVALRRHRHQAAAWAQTNRDRAERTRRLWELAAHAATVLANPTTDIQERVIAVLDITVRVTGSHPCPTCHGRGTIVYPGTGHRPPTVCATCRRWRQLPHLELTGIIPDTPSLDHHTPTEAHYPFRIETTDSRARQAT